MKALVTGAAGFIGSSVVRELLKQGVETKVLVREDSDQRSIDGLDVEKVYGDTRDASSMRLALKGCAAMYHLAALVATWAPDNRAFYEINVEGTKTALTAALDEGVEKVVYTSSIVTIGYHGARSLGTENSEFNLWDTGDHYVRSKYLAEAEALGICGKGLPLVIVNPAMVIGARDVRPTPNGKMIVDLLGKRKPVYIDRGLNIVDVEDVARGHVLAAERGRIGERYILGNENIESRELFELVADVSGVEPPRFRMPRPAALIVALVSQSVASVTRKPPLLTMSSVRTAPRLAYFDVSKAVNELGLPRTPIRTTLEKAVDWFRANGYVNAT
jgi:dihydroflavonol-4-reductase